MTHLKRGYRGLHTVWFNDEAPRIGSGNRVVEVWVGNHHVRLVDPISGKRQRILRTLFDQAWAATLKQRTNAKTIIDKRTGNPVTKETVAERFS